MSFGFRRARSFIVDDGSCCASNLYSAATFDSDINGSLDEGDVVSFVVAEFGDPGQKEAETWAEKFSICTDPASEVDEQRAEYCLNGFDLQLWSAAAAGDVNALAAAMAVSSKANFLSARALHGRTALHMAAACGSVECVAHLLEARADAAARTHLGLTPLHVAAERGHADAARTLLAHGADIMHEAGDGGLALHSASARGQTPVISVLLEHRAQEQLSHRNGRGQCPRDVAADISVCDALRQAEANSCHGCRVSRWSLETADSYVGRTVVDGLVLRNSRTDVVRRALHRTKHPPPLFSADAISSRQPASFFSVSREPFAQVKAAEGQQADELPGPNTFIVVGLLGKGSFGKVYQVQHRETKKLYAMKILEKSQMYNHKTVLRSALAERDVLSYLKHPYIVSLHWAFQTASHLALVLQLCPGGSLDKLVRREKGLHEPLARLYTAEVLLALCYLHERSVIYRDMKPQNVVLDEEGHALLTDFGLSREGAVGLHGSKSFVGTSAFLAPEILNRRGHGHTVDIYGLGVLLFNMLTDTTPFYHDDRETLFANIKHASLRVPAYVGRDAAAFISRTMEREPARRLGAVRTEDAQSHAFFACVDWPRLAARAEPVPPALPDEFLPPPQDESPRNASTIYGSDDGVASHSLRYFRDWDGRGPAALADLQRRSW